MSGLLELRYMIITLMLSWEPSFFAFFNNSACYNSESVTYPDSKGRDCCLSATAA